MRLRTRSRRQRLRNRLDGSVIQPGKELASRAADRAQDLAELAPGAAREAAEAAVVALQSRRQHRSRIRRRATFAGTIVFTLAALAVAGYVWWRRQRQDEEYARLQHEPDRPIAPPASPTAPTDEQPNTSTPIEEGGVPDLASPQPALSSERSPWNSSNFGGAPPAGANAANEQSHEGGNAPGQWIEDRQPATPARPFEAGDVASHDPARPDSIDAVSPPAPREPRGDGEPGAGFMPSNFLPGTYEPEWGMPPSIFPPASGHVSVLERPARVAGARLEHMGRIETAPFEPAQPYLLDRDTLRQCAGGRVIAPSLERRQVIKRVPAEVPFAPGVFEDVRVSLEGIFPPADVAPEAPIATMETTAAATNVALEAAGAIEAIDAAAAATVGHTRLAASRGSSSPRAPRNTRPRQVTVASRRAPGGLAAGPPRSGSTLPGCPSASAQLPKRKP